ncbi:MAG: DUF899 domain-containing protein [Proteobacteria bacterium]|nr:DUF899 domain-containing protein [Pseudomonadota bacterium]
MGQRTVTRDEWMKARMELLAEEKQFSHTRDKLAQMRREMPRVAVPNYVFEDEGGQVTLMDLFDGRSQLIVYHFMFDPKWDAGCKSCSFVADHFQHAVPHLAQRDVTLVAASLAGVAKLQAYRARMGWTHRWVSSAGSPFNYDFGVSFTEAQIAEEAPYNYGSGKAWGEAPGLSVFSREGDTIFHTYSTYSRGLDVLINTYNYLDLVPRGRNYDGNDAYMGWLRRRDEYPREPA